MLAQRAHIIDPVSEQAFQACPLPAWLQTLKDLLSPAVILAAVAPFYSSSTGRPSEDPVLLFKVLFLSFLFNVKGDENILATLRQRLDWLQFCDLGIGAVLPDRTTLVKFRRTELHQAPR